MRPGRPDIAAPEFPARIDWIGEQAKRMEELTTTGPVLVNFFDFAQLNSVRSLPYLTEWQRRYSEVGLAVIGVQAHRFPFGAERQTVARGLERLEVAFPVAIDAEREMWLDYGCKGWPSLFLWGRGGALRWYHFGEGEYLATEEAIQDELRELEATAVLPQPVESLRATDRPDARVMPPTPELFPGGSHQRAWSYGDSETIEVDYAAGGAYATVEGSGELLVELDGATQGTIAVDGAFLYELASHPSHEAHRLVLRPGDGLRIWSISFAAGVP